jgi:probable phosphoglycerate mutase
VPTRVLLIRHGQSVWNAAGRWQGQADPELSPAGRAQAVDAALRVGAIDAVVASDLRRAMETAILIAQQLGVGPVLIEPRLREVGVGEWTGLTRAEIEEAWPGFLADGRRPPAAEPWADAVDRVLAALVDLGVRHPGADVLAVAHAGVILGLERHLGEHRAMLTHLDGTWFEVDGEDVALGDRVRLVADGQIAAAAPQSL